jgi:hypothetical protein
MTANLPGHPTAIKAAPFHDRSVSSLVIAMAPQADGPDPASLTPRGSFSAPNSARRRSPGEDRLWNYGADDVLAGVDDL